MTLEKERSLQTKSKLLYKVRSGVYSIDDFNSTVVLDINQNKYLAFDGFASEVWNKIRNNDFELSCDEYKKQIKYFLENKIIEKTHEYQAKVVDVNNSKHREITNASDLKYSNKFSVFGFIFLSIAYIQYHFFFKKRHIKECLVFLQKKRKKKLNNPHYLARTVSTYTKLRKFNKYGSRDCLPRSFILSYSLALQGIDSRLIIGIDNFPFRAHAWVEANNLVLNDKSKRVKQFKIIAAF